MFNERMRQPKLKMPEPLVPPSHPFRNKENHEQLIQYLRQRLAAGKRQRDARLERMRNIDKAYSGWIALSVEDRDRIRERARTGKPLATDISLPLTMIHIDDMMTYFVQTFAPSRGMFYHTGKQEEVGMAGVIVTLMNNHAQYGAYFRHILLSALSGLKYNLAGITSRWSIDYGPKLTVQENGVQQVEQVPIWEGNLIESLDLYNTFWDPLTQPSQVYKEGEYAGFFYAKSHNWLLQRAAAGAFFNLKDLFAQQAFPFCRYYVKPSNQIPLSTDVKEPGGTDWVAALSGMGDAADMLESGYELTEIYIRLNPTEFGLVPRAEIQTRNRLEIWRFTIAGGDFIIDATHMSNMHGHIPFYLSYLNDDLMEDSQKSVAEILAPLQDLASHMCNVHIKSSRRNLWGLMIYDPMVVDLSQIPDGEVAGRIPIQAAAAGRDIDSAIWQSAGVLDTKQTMQDVQTIMTLISQFFPTSQAPSQIAGIDRAVTDQVAAVQQGVNRRNQKYARLLDASLFTPMRTGLYYNILQFQQDGAQVIDAQGRPITVDMTALRATDMPWIIGQGFKALDRQAAASALKEIILIVFQNPVAAQQMGVGLIDLLDQWASMLDVEVDFKSMLKGAAPAPGEAPPTQPQGPVL